MRMTYRDDLEAARMRRDALARELREVRGRMGEYQEVIRREQALERELTQSAQELDRARARVELPLLRQVRVASPCKERWDDMAGDGHVRFCGRCEKNVYDLSALTASQAEALLQERGESKCVRFYRRTDGTVLTSDCPVGTRKRFWRRVATSAVATGMAAAGLTMFVGSQTMVMGEIEPVPPVLGEPVVGMLAASNSELGEVEYDIASLHGSELPLLDHRIARAEAWLAEATTAEERAVVQQQLDELRAQRARIAADPASE
jgi:hypothetical protein